MKQVRLNRVEVWIADHALPIFGAVAVAIIAGAVAIFVVFLGQKETRDQVNVLRPQVTRVNKAICDKQSLTHEGRAARCAERIRVGLVNCRRVERCRAALLAAITYPPPARSPSPSPSPEGGGAQNPSTAGQQPAPGSPGGGQGGGHGDGQNPGSKSPTPTPKAESTPAEMDTGADIPPAEVDQESAEETSQVKPGLLDDPGGVLGDVVCTVNRLGIRVCTE